MKKIVVHDYAGHPFTFSFSKVLAKKYKVYHLFFANDPGPKSDLNKGKNKNLSILGIGKTISYNKNNLFLRFFKDIQYGIEVKKKINIIKPDIVISANCPTFAQQSILSATKENNSKFIMWIQDFYSIAVHQTLKKKFSFFSFFISFLFTILEKKQINFSDHLITISKDFNKTLLKWGVDKKKITFIPNWGNLDQIKVGKKDYHFLKKNNLSKDKLRIVYSGTLALKHNPDLIVSIAKENLDMELLITAGGSGFDSLKKRKDLPPNIKLLPLQPFQIFNKVLNSADFFLAMLNKEASKFSVPSKILNYLCVGKPIILSAPLTNLSSKVIFDSKAGKTFDPTDFNKLNNFIKLLKNNNKIRLQMANNGRLYAKTNFDLKKVSIKFVNIFNKI